MPVLLDTASPASGSSGLDQSGPDPRLVIPANAGLRKQDAEANIRAADANRAGENAELDAIFAVVVGGTALTGGRFTIFGSFLGAVLIQTLAQTMYYRVVPPAVAPVPKALLILAVSLLQSDKLRRWAGGLWRRKERALA